MRASTGTILFLLALPGCGSYSPLDSPYNRGVEYYDQGRLGEAIREYRRAIEEDPQNYRARFNLAVCFQDQGKLDAALREYGETLRIQPRNARALVNMASILTLQGKDREALELLEGAVQADPDSGFPRSSLGAYYERKGDLDRALAEYRKSVAIEPEHITGHYRLGKLLQESGKLDEALAEFEAALAVDPDDVASLLASAGAREAGGDEKGASLYLERALVFVPRRGDLWLWISRLYEAQDRLEDAVSALWRARAILPEDSTIRPRLASLYARLLEAERGRPAEVEEGGRE